jgi:predicted membrane protein
MSWRARDVLPITVGAYLIALGFFFLSATLHWVSIGAAGMVGGAFGLAFIALGILAIIAAWRVRRVSRRLRRAIGHVRSDVEGWSVEDAVVSTVIGDISLDLRRADLPEGDTELTLLCWLGTIQVRVPRDVGVDVTGQAIIGTVDILGRREEGVVRDFRMRSPNYDAATRRVQMRLSTFVGELLVVQSSR